jgi:nucleoporin NUP82
MVYVLMASGDVYAMGPVLPLHTDMPHRYLQGLKAYLVQRGAHGSSAVASSSQATLQAQWVDNLVWQVKAVEEADREKQDAILSPSRKGSIRRGTRRQSTQTERPPPPQGTVRVHPPHLTESGGPASGLHRPIMRQGPIICHPAPPEEDDEDDEVVASDLVVQACSSGDDVIVGLVWSNGRVDIGAFVDPPDLKWATPRVSLLNDMSYGAEMSRKNQLR